MEFERLVVEVLRTSSRCIQIRIRLVVGADLAHVQIVAGTAQRKAPTQVLEAVVGTVARSVLAELARTGIQVSDSRKLTVPATPNLLAKSFGPQSGAVSANLPKTDKAAAFQAALRATAPGKKQWSRYQRLVADILEFLFCPPLEPPRYEVSDSALRNRRDIIFENRSIKGFWTQVREDYSGHYIVVDAKNHANPISKKAVLEIAHYLKPHGCGRFALLVSRQGPDGSATYAMRETWSVDDKMIVHLSDENLRAMLELKANGGQPEDVIRRLIADFRTSL